MKVSVITTILFGILVTLPGAMYANKPLVINAAFRKEIQNWAKKIGNEMNTRLKTLTGYDSLKTHLQDLKDRNELKVNRIDGTVLVDTAEKELNKDLDKKVQAIRRIVTEAEKLHKAYENTNFTENPELKEKFIYYNAKKINDRCENGDLMPDSLALDLVENPKFDYIPTNDNQSTVHVPTNVYDKSDPVVNGVNWTDGLNNVFIQNYKNDPGLSWQYFGSASGFFRIYPGMKWHYADIDLYDARMQPWYIEAATSPKDVVLIVDSSGSMTGLRLEIAKATVRKILDTLSDNDYFNIIAFNKTYHYIDPCAKDRLIPATPDNKLRVKGNLDNIWTCDMANWEEAISQAYELLMAAKGKPDSANCNQAIMIITDGAPDSFASTFEKYTLNKPENKKIRVFTYLIGREVNAVDIRNVRWMACKHKGFYTHISTLADVEENVQYYFQRLAIPFARQVAKDKSVKYHKWTDLPFFRQIMDKPDGVSAEEEVTPPEYAESYHSPILVEKTPSEVIASLKSKRLMTSVAMPVFNIKNTTKYYCDCEKSKPPKINPGILLGVTGTDVPIKKFSNLLPNYKLGVNAYSFGIANNGYVLFHPDFRPLQADGKPKPNYNSVDLAEVEQRLQYDSIKGLPEYNMTLRTSMFDAVSVRSMTQRIKLLYDDQRRITIQKNVYFYKKVKDTPFSIGIALPVGYGQYVIEAIKNTADYNENWLKTFHPQSLIYLADWEPCELEFKETLHSNPNNNYVEVFKKYVQEIKKNNNVIIERCNRTGYPGMHLVKSMLFDLYATESMESKWPSHQVEAEKYNVERVFVATRAGVTRTYDYINETSTLPTWMKTHSNTIDELYYKKTILNNEKPRNPTATYSLIQPTPAGSTESLVIMGTIPVMVADKAPFGVFGMQQSLLPNSTLIFGQSTTYSSDVNLNCINNNFINCYLLDENGYIVFSTDLLSIGSFFGQAQGDVMVSMMEKGVYKTVGAKDYQAMCYMYKSESTGSANRIMNPLKKLFSSVFWLVQEVGILLLEFNLYSWWNSGTQTTGGDFYEPNDTGLDYEEEQSRFWSNYQEQPNPPKLIGSKPCTTTIDLVKINNSKKFKKQTQEGYIMDCRERCDKSWISHRVPNTNLLLVVVDAVCTECAIVQFSLEPEEMKIVNATACDTLQENLLTKKTSAICHASHDNEAQAPCSMSSHLSAAAAVFYLSIAVALVSIH
ncbi:voltage-dependent calcium channel subunit alpha-2/delta-3-like [Tubulanus polymorphus]|uniref:voltage-dependent calcium channel subunit alpha-2/delta-3-like n=1 Tax=Tubulanus polymorphus TaxID=672921 RepID=UPI003DA25FEE